MARPTPNAPGKQHRRRAPIRFTSRADAVAQLRRRLEHGSWPRVQMMLLVLLTGASGFIASFVLMASGVDAMGLRYGLACLVAYACFLVLLGIWIHWRRNPDTSARDAADALDLLDAGSGFRAGGGPPQAGGWSGGSGQSGGGGASASFEAEGPTVIETPSPSLELPSVSSWSPASSSDKGGFDFDFDLDMAAVPLLLAALVAALLLSSLFVVWAAPVLFAELLLDGVLAAGLYHRLRHIETRHWLDTAVRKTAWPFLLTTLVLALGGHVAQVLVPSADSIGDVVAAIQAR